MGSVLTQLASALGRNDERPNVELAEALATKPDAAAVAELVSALAGGSTVVSNDAIKVLYELGALRPELVAGHAGAFLKLLGSKNNRNVWGALQAVEAVTQVVPDEVLAALPAIIAAADKGSVIAKDKAVQILVKLAAHGHPEVLPTMLERVELAAPNQFPMYAEAAATIVAGTAHVGELRRMLETRLKTIEAPAKRARVETVLRRLGG